MVLVEHSVLIARPLEAVFAFVADYANDARWSAAVKQSERTSPGPLAVGATFRHLTELMGRHIDASGAITELEPNRRVCFRSESGPIPHRDCRTFEESGGGTQLTVTIEAELSGVFKMAEQMVRSVGLQQLRSDLDRLKTLLESGAPPTPP
jgi:uncharacterized membrane protein